MDLRDEKTMHALLAKLQPGYYWQHIDNWWWNQDSRRTRTITVVGSSKIEVLLQDEIEDVIFDLANDAEYNAFWTHLCRSFIGGSPIEELENLTL
jgi:hypothetical protein